jgi:hypothetical protein
MSLPAESAFTFSAPATRLRAATRSFLIVPLAAAVLLLALAASAHADPLFEANMDFPVAGLSLSVAIADLNADGRPDLAVANYGSNTVSVLLGIGDGTFAAFKGFETGLSPFGVAIADLNGDGRPDLAVANYGSNTVSILLGNGDGTFGPKTDFGTGLDPISVAIADLNADGRPDLAVANAGVNTHTVSVLLGNGDGGFAAKIDSRTGRNPFSVAIADLNADGRPELVTTHPGDFTVSVLRGNGAGRFGAKTEYGTQLTPCSVAIADLNLDGRLDLAVACASSNQVSVLLGNGDGSFAAETSFATGSYPRWVAIADLNGDGRPDLVTANLSSPTVSVLLHRSPVRVAFKFDPSTLNLASEGRWVTGALEPVPPLSANDIDVASIRLNGSVPVDRAAPTGQRGLNGKAVCDLKVSFDRASVEATLLGGDRVPVSVTGTVNGREFLGTDTIRVLSAAGRASVDDKIESVAGTVKVALSIRETAGDAAVAGRLRLGFTLLDESPARLEVIDVTGRVLSSRRIEGLRAGPHELELAEGGALPPGIYFIRLRQGANEARTRAAIVR